MVRFEDLPVTPLEASVTHRQDEDVSARERLRNVEATNRQNAAIAEKERLRLAEIEIQRLFQTDPSRHW